MLAVALETSTRAASAAVRGADGTLLERSLAEERAHASDLLPVVDALVREVGGTPADVAAVLVGLGPGSYTGLRVGIATALGIARGAGSALRGVPSVEALAHHALAPGEVGATLLDARAGEVYVAVHARDADDVRALAGPLATSPEEARALVPTDARVFADEAALRAAGLEDDERARRAEVAVPNAAAVLALGLVRLDALGPEPAGAVRPLYLRPFAAKVRKR